MSNMREDFIQAKKDFEDFLLEKGLGWLPVTWRKPVFIFLISLGGILFILSFIQPLLPDLNPTPSSSPLPVLSDEAESEIERKLNEERVKQKCEGAQFDILKELDIIGNERFFKEENGVSVRETENYQASVKTHWGCKMPFFAQVVAIPVSGPSFGLFFEYENVFKVIVGDGDRITLKVEQNKLGERKMDWTPVRDEKGHERQKLGNPIEDGEEVTLVVKAKEKEGWVLLRVEIYHSRFQSVEIFDYSFLPNAVNNKTGQKRALRIGINDFRYKGEGSIIDLKILSIEEKEW